MEYQEILSAIRALPSNQQSKLVFELTGNVSSLDSLSFRKSQLENKQAGCPHCESHTFHKFGKDKGSQRFKCKSCNRTFTEHTGTWLAGLHKKELANDYLELMHQSKSLDKIKVALNINKKTAFDWRHKILSSFENIEKDDFNGIVESDETFFLKSDKGNKHLPVDGRKRGGSSSKRGISKDQVAVIVTSDRKGTIDMKVATLGRIGKVDIKNAIGSRIGKDSILCADGHVSYKGFAKDNNLSLVVLRADLKQYVKNGVYHIQNVNSLHNRIKKWVDATFWGVSTKYLQNYLNWYRVQNALKNSLNPVEEIAKYATIDPLAWRRFKSIEEKYQTLISTQ